MAEVYIDSKREHNFTASTEAMCSEPQTWINCRSSLTS